MEHRTRLMILGLAALLLAGCGANAFAITAAAPFVYAVNTKSNEISQYSASPSDFGALKPLAPATVPTGPFPYGIAIDQRATASTWPTETPRRSPSTRSTRRPVS